MGNLGSEVVFSPHLRGFRILVRVRKTSGTVPAIRSPMQQPESLKGDTWRGTYALDTKTGQLCVTFDPSAFSSVSAIPTCLKLYRDFPE
jgi:hypothetical protein